MALLSLVTFEQAADAADFGTPSARKAGRNPRFPYVPVVKVSPLRPTTRQIKGYAYATRNEALAHAERHIANARRTLARQLADPRYRALREQHGLPREISR